MHEQECAFLTCPVRNDIGNPGSARVSRAGDGVLAIAKVLPRAFTAEITKASDLKLGWHFALQPLSDF